MKKIIILFLSFLCVAPAIQAQNDVRTTTTRIADFLRQLPAENSVKLTAAMEEIGALDEAGLIELIKMLGPVATSDNAKLEYAISGFSGYVGHPGREGLRSKASLAYSKALKENSDPEARSFIMTQLGWIGQDEAVPFLAEFLNDTRLAGPASRALVEINSDAARQVLAQALAHADEPNVTHLLEAVGQTRAKEGIAYVMPYATHAKKEIRKTALNALAKLADPSSAAFLGEQAALANYRYEDTNAFGAYLEYIAELNRNGNESFALKEALKLSKKLSNQEAQAKVSGLKLLVDLQGEKSLKALEKASRDKDKVVRVAALKMAEPFMINSRSAYWIKQLKKATPETRAEMIPLLGKKNMPLLLPVIKAQFTSSYPALKLAAIEAVGRVSGESALEDLLTIAEAGNQDEVEAVKAALLKMEGKKINPSIANALPHLPVNAQVAMLDVLGNKGAHEQFTAIYPFVSSQDKGLQVAALKALSTTSGQDQLPMLFSLLNEEKDKENIEYLQKAIVFGLRDLKGNSAQANYTINEMDKVGVNQQAAYYPILSAIGGKEGLGKIEKAYLEGEGVNKLEAARALSQWKDDAALPALRNLIRENKDPEIFEVGLRGALRLINASPTLPSDQKVLFLKEAMELSTTAAQRRSVLRALSAQKTFPALAYAGKFFSDKELASQVASTVNEIALSNPALQGELVKKYLHTTLDVLKGQDSEYLREAIRKHLLEMNDEVGFVEVFNGKDLTGWKGLVENPIARRKMDAKTLAAKQQEADKVMRSGWEVKNGELLFLGKGDNLATVKDYGNIEMWVDWKIYDDGHKDGDAGIYLKGTPQVQIWDTSRVEAGAQVGSGGLYNNQKNPSIPLAVADNPLGEWNTFYIKMIDDKVTVYLNGVLVTDNVLLENYWDRNLPLYAKEQIELQAHGSRIGYRDIYIKELEETERYQLTEEEKQEGYELLFDGSNLDNWIGNTKDYTIVNKELVIQPNEGSGGNLFTRETYGDFVFRFEFKLTEGANNGLGVRAPLEGDAAYQGIEIQILDDTADIYKDLKPYQYHGSLYGIMAAKRGYLKPIGEWNYEEVQVKGDHFKVILNGTTILDGSIADAKANGTLDGENHPGIFRNSGHIGFLGHGSKVSFRNIRVKKL